MEYKIHESIEVKSKRNCEAGVRARTRGRVRKRERKGENRERRVGGSRRKIKQSRHPMERKTNKN